MAGKDVELNIYVRKGDEDKCAFGMEALKKSIIWDEKFYEREHDLTNQEFHPHVVGLAPIMQNYLSRNPDTQHLQIEVDELKSVLNSLDLVILNARLEDNELWGTPFYYKKLRKMLKGYLIACE